MTEPQRLLLNATEAGALIGVTAATFRRMVDQGRVPACIQHKSTYGQERCRRYNLRLLELWAAGVDVEHLADADLVLLLAGTSTTRRPSPVPEELST